MCVLWWARTGVTHGGRWFSKRPWLCEVVASFCLTACFCAFFSLGFLTINRYFFIVHNRTYEKVFSKLRAVFVCGAIWIAAFGMEVGNFLGWGDHYFDAKSMQCIWERTATLSYTVFLAAGLVGGPLLLMILCYVIIFIKVYRSKKELACFNRDLLKVDQTLRAVKEAVQVCRMMVVVVLAFCVCWLPYIVVISVDMEDKLPLWVHLWATYLAHLHSAINWIIYGITNPAFRKGYKEILASLVCCPEKEDMDSVVTERSLVKSQLTTNKLTAFKDKMSMGDSGQCSIGSGSQSSLTPENEQDPSVHM